MFFWSIAELSVRTEPSYITSNYNPGDISKLCDGDLETRWTSLEPQKEDMYIDFGFAVPQAIDRIILKTVTEYEDRPRGIAMFGKNQNGDWEAIESTLETDGETIVLKNKRPYSEFRIQQTGMTNWNWWSITELRLCTANSTAWSLKDTQDSIAAIHANYGSDSVDNLLKGIYWESGALQSPDMEICMELREGNAIKGFHMDSGGRFYESGREIHFVGSDNGVFWEEIKYHFGSPFDYVFDAQCDYRFYKIKQTGSDNRYHWGIAQLGVLK